MSESCATCKLCLNIEKWDFSDVKKKGVPKQSESGYACMVFAHEGLCVHMVGCIPENEMCECYTPKMEVQHDS